MMKDNENLTYPATKPADSALCKGKIERFGKCWKPPRKCEQRLRKSERNISRKHDFRCNIWQMVEFALRIPFTSHFMAKSKPIVFFHIKRADPCLSPVSGGGV